MSKQPSPKARIVALRKQDVNRPHSKAHERLQRSAVVIMGCLWLLAFATGCGRNTKNCSAYDGVSFESAQPIQAQN